jgi:2-phosphosulfolactate phosphatase
VSAFDQAGFFARCEWGAEGLRELAPSVEVLVIVDVLSFSTDVDVAAARGAFIYPFAVQDGAAEFAADHDALLAVHRLHESAEHPYSLSPRSLLGISRATRVVLPSLNGSTLTGIAAESHVVLAGCLRNARAVAEWALPHGRVGVIAAGELRRDRSLRFAIEDLLGAGAILSHFPSRARSPEADVAVAAFRAFEHELPRKLADCASGRELAGIGFAEDVAIAAELDVSDTVPRLMKPGWYAATLE